MSDEGLGSRARTIREHFGYSATQMATAVGLKNRKSWEDYERGNHLPIGSVLLKLASTGIDTNWLLTGKGQMLHGDAVATIRSETTKNRDGVPIYDAAISLGTGNFSCENIIGMLDIPPDYLKDVLGVKQEQAIAVYMDGSSMSPSLMDRDLAIIDTSIGTLERDDIYAFSLEGVGYIKRLQKAGVKVIIHSDNACYRDWSISGERLTMLRIIGRVAGTIRRI